MNHESDSHQLSAVSALDGRYASRIQELSPYVSEKALIESRLRVEALWLLHLDSHLPASSGISLTAELKSLLRDIGKRPHEKAAMLVKNFEKTTNHDVKACEYYLKQVLTENDASEETLAYIHFACTSEDINNLSYGLMLQDARTNSLIPAIEKILDDLKSKANEFKHIPMLSRTHGQTASPTTLGKEIAVFSHRLEKVMRRFSRLDIEGKINGAVGNFNAHSIAFPDINWPAVAKDFVEKELLLSYNPLTTQIENHDSMIEFTECIRRMNTILIGLARDIWTYISLGYFSQKTLKGEVGSSTMPHKVNPIDFENAEGNYGVANALAYHFSEKLPISRLQRDLTDSTVQRTIGTFLGHTLVAHKSLLKGLSKITPRVEQISKDLDNAIEVLAEPIQTVLRKYGTHDAYERLKDATRGQAPTQESLHALIDSCNQLPPEEKEKLKALKPRDYIGIAPELVDSYLS